MRRRMLGLAVALACDASAFAQTAKNTPPAPELQSLCADPASVCGAQVAGDCLERVGAGSLAAGDEARCGAQFEAYRACLTRAAEQCGAAAPTVANDADCPAEDARALWADLEDSAHAEELEAFAAACAGRPQAVLASARAARLKAGGSATPTPAVEAGARYVVAAVTANLRIAPGPAAAGVGDVGFLVRGSLVEARRATADAAPYVEVDVLAPEPGSSLRGGRGWLALGDLQPAAAGATAPTLAPGDMAVVVPFTQRLTRQPTAANGILDEGFLTAGSVVRVLDRAESEADGRFLEVEVEAAAPQSVLRGSRGWAPAASLAPDAGD